MKTQFYAIVTRHGFNRSTNGPRPGLHSVEAERARLAEDQARMIAQCHKLQRIADRITLAVLAGTVPVFIAAIVKGLLP